MTAVVEVPTDLTGEQTEEFLVKGMEEVVDGSGWLKLIQRLIPSLALILGILLALRLLDKKKLADIGWASSRASRGICLRAGARRSFDGSCFRCLACLRQHYS